VRVRPFPRCSLRSVALYFLRVFLLVCVCVKIVCIHIYNFARGHLFFSLLHPLSFAVHPALLPAHASEYVCMDTCIHKMSGAAAPTTRAIRCRSYLLSRLTPLSRLYVISRTHGAILIGWGCQSVLSASCKVAACHRNASNESKTRPEYIPSCNRARGTESGVWVGLLSSPAH